MNCPTCGATLADGTATCPTCGAAISPSTEFNQIPYQQPQTGYNQAQFQQPQTGYDQAQYQQTQTSYNQAQFQQPQTDYNQAQFQAGYNQMPYPNSAAYTPTGTKPKRKFNAGHFAVMGGSLLCLISVFLPFLSVSLFGFKESMSLFKDGDDGVIFLVAAIVVIVFSLLRVDVLNIILTLIQGGFAVFEILNANQELGDLSGYSFMVNYEAGYYLLLIGGIAAFVGAIVGLILRIKAKNAFTQA